MFNEAQTATVTWHMLISKLDVDDVGSRLRGFVGDTARSIFVVMTLDVSLAGALDRQAHATIACSNQSKL